VADIFYDKYKDSKIDVIAGIESRGFILAGILAEKLNTGLVLLRKPGKLPYETVKQEYSLEYGTDTIEMHKDSIKLGQKVLLVDDLIATGGTTLASCGLIKKLGGQIVDCAFIIELEELGGVDKLKKEGISSFSVMKFKENEL
jgi:adenine phosphoribosyltransferase